MNGRYGEELCVIYWCTSCKSAQGSSRLGDAVSHFNASEGRAAAGGSAMLSTICLRLASACTFSLSRPGGTTTLRTCSEARGCAACRRKQLPTCQSNHLLHDKVIYPVPNDPFALLMPREPFDIPRYDHRMRVAHRVDESKLLL